ncbi:MAG: RecQ family ATP-dependent DNA helicase [Armatimonadota bacterium]
MGVARGELLRQLREQFGFEEFRPGQEEIIRALLDGEDVLAVLPTGAGKSLVFQLASQLLPGVTVVVSPLIALMKDQTDAAEERGLEAGLMNSTRTEAQAEEELRLAETSRSRLLYVTPERLEDPELLSRLREAGVALLAVDEAHCLSEWGHDFRPAYLVLGEAVRRLGRPQVLALTATATPWIRRELIEKLGMREPLVVVHGIDRPNLYLEVRRVEREDEDRRVLRSLLVEREGDEPARPPELAHVMEGPGIVYTATTRGAAETAEWLREWGIEADFYHGQRKKSDRERVQEGFMSGELRAIAATSAFGLGIDKPDVRWVIHRDVPASLEEYYQEAGRAGRDGEPACCVLIFRAGDLGRATFLSAGSRISIDDLRRVRKAFKRREEWTAEELQGETELGKGKLRRLLSRLREERIVASAAGRIRVLRADFDPERVRLDTEESRRAFERSRLQMMRGYAERWDCRRAYLLRYFGEEPASERCGFCDNDRAAEATAEEPAREATFAPGTRVRHPEWGEGRVVAEDGTTLHVEFATAGEKRLEASVVAERGLLQSLGGALPPLESETSDAGLRAGDAVTHPDYGDGEVQSVTDAAVTVLFETAGYHVLDRKVVEERDLLRPAA